MANAPKENSDTNQPIVPESQEVVPNSGDLEKKQTVSVTAWSAPLPPPQDFNAYPEPIQDRIMTMAENEGRHRYDYQQKQLEAIERMDKRKHITFSAISFAVIIIGGLLLWKGDKGSGLALAIIGSLGILGRFLRMLYNMVGDRDDKSKKNGD